MYSENICLRFYGVNVVESKQMLVLLTHFLKTPYPGVTLLLFIFLKSLSLGYRIILAIYIVQVALSGT